MASVNLTVILQIITGIVIGIIAFFIKREFKRFDDSVAANKARIDLVEEKSKSNVDSLEVKLNCKFDKLKEEVNDLKSDLPFIYVTREDFIRSMDNVDRSVSNVAGKLDKIYEHMTGKGV